MIKVATLSKNYRHISRMDDALSIPEDKLEEVFGQWLEGKAELTFKEGYKPTTFEFSRPSPKVHAMIMDAETRGGTMEAIVTAVELTLRSVDNLTDETGKEIEIKTHTDSKGVTRLAKESLDIFMAAPELLYELGSRVVSELNVKKK